MSVLLPNLRSIPPRSITGSIEVGKYADILVADKNPLDDFRNMSVPYMVVARGKVYKEKLVKKYEKCETELDKYC